MIFLMALNKINENAGIEINLAMLPKEMSGEASYQDFRSF
jgi:hypothetical protein